LTYEQYWTGFERLFERTDVIAIGEPLVRVMAGLPPCLGGCGVATVRVTPRATVRPCVYWPGGAPLDILLHAGPNVVATKSFVDGRSVPQACAGCSHLAACGGGCAGRRRLMGALGAPDPYCPIVRNDQRRLAIRQAAAREMPKLESACTTIVIGRGSHSLYRVEVDCQDTRRGRADVLYIVHSMCRPGEGAVLLGKCIARWMLLF